MQTQQVKKRTIHVFFEEEDENEVMEVDADPEIPPQEKSFALICLLFIAFLCVIIPTLSTILLPIYPNTHDRTVSKTITLTLSLRPTYEQLTLYPLAQIGQTQHITVPATGSQHVLATHANGLITFYNGLFTSQIIPTGTTLRGKSGIAVVTTQTAIIPAATPTTPPTYGTVSVMASSVLSGTTGNIPASDIDQACCAPSVLAQNLYAFSGGMDAKNIPVLTKTALAAGMQQLKSQVEAAVINQAQKETKPRYVLLPLDCSRSLTANHQAGDQAASATITLTEICTPLAYFAPDILTLARYLLTIPTGYQLVSFSAFVVQSHVTAKGGTLTIQAIAYLRHTTPVVSPYHFVGK